MARKNNGPANLSTPTARAVLPAKDTIHWKVLDKGLLHIGYRKRKAGVAGIWFVRRYIGADERGIGHYNKTPLGSADDFEEANGTTILTYFQAQQKAIATGTVKLAEKTAEGPLTVGLVCDAYLRHLKAHGQHPADAERRIRTHILPSLGATKIEDLTTHRLVQWRDKMAAEPARLRTAKGQKQRFREAPLTPDETRARRATVNRTVTVLKAALNRAFKAGRLHDDLAWRRLEPFAKVDARCPGHLTVEQSVRLVNAADAGSGFRDLVHGALLTGARYSELCRLKVSDFLHGRIVVHTSKSGKGRDIRLTQEGRDYFAQLTAGRKADEPMFRRADGTAWQKSHQARPMQAAVEAARISPAISFHELRYTVASLAIMNGTPLLVVAENLGHADSRMCEKHYTAI